MDNVFGGNHAIEMQLRTPLRRGELLSASLSEARTTVRWLAEHREVKAPQFRVDELISFRETNQLLRRFHSRN